MYKNLDGTCNYPILKEHKYNPKFMCKINALKERCNKIDDCYVYCYSNDVGVRIGGGCTHLCNYSLKKEHTSPKGFKECTKL